MADPPFVLDVGGQPPFVDVARGIRRARQRSEEDRGLVLQEPGQVGKNPLAIGEYRQIDERRLTLYSAPNLSECPPALQTTSSPTIVRV